MRQGKASVLHKESRTGSRAAHKGNTPFCTHTHDKGKAVGRRRVRKKGRVGKRTKKEKEGITGEDMVRSSEQEIPAWVCVGTLLLLIHSVTVSGGKKTNGNQ